MTLLQVFEVLCGCILIFIGWRFIRIREIPVTSEGSNTPFWWIRGRDSVFAGVVVIGLGFAFFAGAAGIFQLP
ncbi:MAG: hypothetical protein AB7I35_02925 [Ramlibacter sp.]